METWESLSEAVALLDAPEPEQTESSLRDTGGTILYKLCGFDNANLITRESRILTTAIILPRLPF